MNPISADQITSLQLDKTIEWHKTAPAISTEALLGFIEDNHRNNFLLWHEEDKARRDDMGADYVYQAKRNIDGYNQARNDCMERIDEWLFHHLQPKQDDCPVHSETPGMTIDRLSILTLKEYHMRKQTQRDDVPEEHRMACLAKLDVILQQKQQLSSCLQALLDEIKQQTRTFRVYHQFKMYNDPQLNPQLYENNA